MTVLQRTDLTTSQKIQCAAAAVAGQHAHGSKTALSEAYEISRPTVYAVGAAAESVLRSHFETPLLQGAAVDVRVDDAQLRRAVVAMRVLAPNAIRPIEDLEPLLYPGVKVSYGTIQHMLVEAEARAARLNAQASLGGVEAGALDEMFSQGEPVLAGVDLDSGYLFGLSLSATRDGDAWAELLREGQAQGLELSVVVKDAAKGIAAGVSEVFPRAEQRDDCFHVLYEMHKVRRLSAPFRKCTKTAVVEVLVTSWHLLRYLFDSLSSSPPDGLGQALYPPCARHFQTDRSPTISRRR